jgi:hypothetical protein
VKRTGKLGGNPGGSSHSCSGFKVQGSSSRNLGISLANDRTARPSRALDSALDLFPSDKQLLHQLVPLGVFFFRFFDAVFLVDVGFFEFLRQ